MIHKHFLKATILLLALITLGSGILHAQETGPTPYPDDKDTASWPGKGPIRFFSWMTINRKTFWTHREEDQGKVVFVGDSIIGSWKLDNDFPGKPVTNRGIGGDLTRGLLFRFKEDVLDLHPKAIVIHIGGNDLSADGQVSDAMSNFNAMLDMVQESNAETPVIILAVLPRGIPTGAKAPSAALGEFLQKVSTRVSQLNAELAKIPATRKNVTFVDTYTLFMLPDGTLDGAQFNDDKVHLTEAGRAKLSEFVVKALAELKLP